MKIKIWKTLDYFPYNSIIQRIRNLGRLQELNIIETKKEASLGANLVPCLKKTKQANMPLCMECYSSASMRCYEISFLALIIYIGMDCMVHDCKRKIVAPSLQVSEFCKYNQQ